MDFKEIQELIKLINKSNLTEFKMKDGGFQLSIRTKKYGRGRVQQVVQSPQQILPIQAAPQPVQQAIPVPAPAQPSESLPAKNAGESKKDTGGKENDWVVVKSPIVGTFYRSASPEKPPYAKVGDRIEVGSVVCIVEAMKLFNEIESEVSGTIVKVLIENASPVEYDQELFYVDPNG